MIRRIFDVFVVEIIKAVRWRFTYVGPAIVLLTTLVAPLAYPIQRDHAGDYGFVAYAVQVSLNMVGFFFLLVYCSNLVASEIGRGTVRAILVQPIRRRELLLAKLSLGIVYATLLSLIAASAAWTIAFIFGDLSGVHYGGDVLYTNREMQATFIRAFLLALLPQYAAVTYALLISVSSRNATTAVGLSVGLWLFVDTVKYPLGIPQFFFSSYLETPWKVFINRSNAISTHTIVNGGLENFQWLATLVEQGVVISLFSIGAFTALALYTFSRRGLT